MIYVFSASVEPAKVDTLMQFSKHPVSAQPLRAILLFAASINLHQCIPLRPSKNSIGWAFFFLSVLPHGDTKADLLSRRPFSGRRRCFVNHLEKKWAEYYDSRPLREVIELSATQLFPESLSVKLHRAKRVTHAGQDESSLLGIWIEPFFCVHSDVSFQEPRFAGPTLPLPAGRRDADSVLFGRL